MGCGISKFKEEETQPSYNSQPNSIDDQQLEAHKYGRRSVSSHLNNDDNRQTSSGDRQVDHEEASNGLNEDQLGRDRYANRLDSLKYPGSPSFRVYCDSDIVDNLMLCRPTNDFAHMVDHVARKKSYLSRNMDERCDVDKGLGVESSVVKKESRVRRLTGAILRSSQQRKYVHQKS